MPGEERALEEIRFLSDEIKAFVAKHGSNAAPYFERALHEWYGALDQRVRFLSACAEDPDLHEAWRIVHAAGYRAATLLPMVVRHYYGGHAVDERV